MEKLNALFFDLMMHPGSATIQISRVFDERAAGELALHTELLLDRGVWRITLDFSATSGVLDEAIRIFWRAHERWLTGVVEFSLRAVHLPPTLARSLALRGLPFHQRVLELEYPAPSTPPPQASAAGAGNSPGTSDRSGILLCTACEHPLHTKGPGLYACPECGSHFHVDAEGRSVIYEPLYKMGSEKERADR